MTKRKTIEIIVETEELLIVNQRSRAISLKCPECGALVEPLASEGNAASLYHSGLELPTSESLLHENAEGSAVQENQQMAAFPLIRRFPE